MYIPCNSRSPVRSAVRRFAALSLAVCLPFLILIVGAGSAEADELNSGCDRGTFISNIELENNGYWGTKIKVTPTNAARAGSGPGSGLTNPMWAALQSCVPGLYGSVADSIYQQLDCHVLGGQFEFATGHTWDLETWLVPLDSPNLRSYYDSHCLNFQPTRVHDYYYVA